MAGYFYESVEFPNSNHIARWDIATSTWHALGSGLNDRTTAVAVAGSDVYAGGWFTNAGGIGNADYIARWDTSNSTWNALGSGVNDTVYAIAVEGSDIYVGG